MPRVKQTARKETKDYPCGLCATLLKSRTSRWRHRRTVHHVDATGQPISADELARLKKQQRRKNPSTAAMATACVKAGESEERNVPDGTRSVDGTGAPSADDPAVPAYEDISDPEPDIVIAVLSDSEWDTVEPDDPPPVPVCIAASLCRWCGQ